MERMRVHSEHANLLKLKLNGQQPRAKLGGLTDDGRYSVFRNGNQRLSETSKDIPVGSGTE
eukprot:scaffold72819_cov17-Tisochrysis_lutea.AAC.2